jgi:transcriptional regulator with XRE-family HTH domain
MVQNVQFTEDELKKIGTRMRTARVLTGLKREEFAQKHNLSSVSLKNWELGRILPRYDGMIALVNALKECGIFVSPEWILFGNGTGPNYYYAQMAHEDKTKEEFISEQVSLFKKAQRSKGFNPVVLTVKDEAMGPTYRKGDLLGGILVSQEFVKTDLAQNLGINRPWLITLDNGSFMPAFIYANHNRWLINTIKNPELQEISRPSFAKIKWHYDLGEQI